MKHHIMFNYVYEAPHNVWASGICWQVKHSQTTNWKRHYCRPLFLFTQQLYLATFEFTHQRLCTSNVIKQLCLWSTTQGLSVWQMKHGQTTNWKGRYCRSLFPFTSQLYLTTFKFTYLDTLYLKRYQTTMPMNHCTMFEPLTSAGKWNKVKKPIEGGVIVSLYFYLLNNFIWPLLNLHI
jgi:hypothetical protein